MNEEPVKFNMEVIRKAVDKAVVKANTLEQNAAFGGSMHDGGASLIRTQVIAYLAGINRTIPLFLEPFVKEVNREEDPEYSKFLELKKKFE